jgi:TPR repeat protein
MNNLAYLYAEGIGVDRDPARAAEWLGHAAARGDSVAQFNYGWALEVGDGIAPDKVRALMWYGLAAAAGMAEAAERGRALAATLSEAEFDRAEAMIRDWRPVEGMVE